MTTMLEKSAPNKKQPAQKAPVPAPAPAAPKPAAPVKPLTPEMKQRLEQITHGLDMLQEDTSIPRNIRRGAEDAKKLIWNDTLALDVRKSNAIGILDDLANDPNIPAYGRTIIYSLLGQLESVR